MTIQHHRSLQLLFLIATCLTIGLSGLATAKSPARFEIQGSVTGANHKTIADATVMLIAAGDSRSQLSEINPVRPTLETRTDSQGGYRVGFDADDHRFFARGDSLLLVRADGFLATLVSLPIERLKVDVPLDIELERAESVTVSVIDANGKPVIGASLYPASINGLRIPWVAARKFSPAVTDDSGKTKIQESLWRSLGTLFVVGDQVGRQRTDAILIEPGHLSTRTAVTRSVVGQISTSNGGEKIPGIENVRMLVVTTPPGSRRPFFEVPTACSWAMVPISALGNFRVDSIAVGNLFYVLDCDDKFPYRETYRRQQLKIEPGESDFRWYIEFQKQTKLTVTILDAESGDPLPNIFSARFGSRLSKIFTDDQGRASYYRNTDHVSFYPSDPRGEFIFLGSTDKNSKKVAVDGEIELEPLKMVRSSRWRGTVVDQQDRPVPGARVDYSFSRERSNQEETVFSDSRGRYRLSGIADGTAVKVTATHDLSVSSTNSFVFPPQDDKPLVLVERESASPIGRIVAPDGKPMPNVPVILKRGKVVEKESYEREQLIPEAWYPTPVIAWTNQSGVFRFPPTVAFGERLRVRVSDDRFFPFYSNYIDGSKISVGEDRSLDLGDFRVAARPASRKISVNVRTDSREPVAGAQVVVVGARTGTINGTTDSNGLFSAEVATGVSIVAVRDDGYRVHFSEFPFDSNSLDLTLHKDLVPTDSEDQPAKEFARVDFERAANQIFSAIEVPELGSSSLHRMRLYSLALSAISPEDYMEFLESLRELPPRLMMVAVVSTGEEAISERPDLLSDLVDKVTIPPMGLVFAAITAADSSEDQEIRDEWLAEALVAARSLTGEQQVRLTVNLARMLLTAGKIELAKDIVAQSWSEASDLQQLVNKNQRKPLIGDSRSLGPALAMIDLQKSYKLIELTARESEISALKSDALLIWAQANPDEFVKHLESGSIEPIDRVSSWIWQNIERDRLAKIGIPKPVDVSRLFNDPKERLDFLLHHARITPDRDLQHRLLDLAVDAIGQCKPSAFSDRFSVHYSKSLLRELRRMPNIAPDQLDSLLFAALQNLPSQFDSDQRHTVLGGAAQLLALKDRQLARTLLEPAIHDRGWLFMSMLQSIHEQETLMAIGRIDPAWSIEIVDEMCNEELKDSASDQLDFRSGMVTRLIAEMRRL